jgi:DNA-binding winged helix-turn-helix (wHTH) protein
MDVAWAGLTVEESNLAVQIAALRRVFGDPKRTRSVVYL